MCGHHVTPQKCTNTKARWPAAADRQRPSTHCASRPRYLRPVLGDRVHRTETPPAAVNQQPPRYLGARTDRGYDSSAYSLRACTPPVFTASTRWAATSSSKRSPSVAGLRSTKPLADCGLSVARAVAGIWCRSSRAMKRLKQVNACFVNRGCGCLPARSALRRHGKERSWCGLAPRCALRWPRGATPEVWRGGGCDSHWRRHRSRSVSRPL